MTPPDDAEPEAAELERVTGDVTRLTYLTDAAVAISLTTIVLYAVPAIVNNQDLTWSDILTSAAGSQFTWIGTTFIVLVICWRYHHVLFEYLRDYDRVMLWFNFIWLFCVLIVPLLTLADLPDTKEESLTTGPVDFVARVLLIRGDEGDPVQNFIIYWVILGLSFIALFVIARRAAYGNPELRRSGDERRLSSRVYLRPALVCFATAVLGGIWIDLDHWFLWIGIFTAIAVAQWEKRRQRASEASATTT